MLIYVINLILLSMADWLGIDHGEISWAELDVA